MDALEKINSYLPITAQTFVNNLHFDSHGNLWSSLTSQILKKSTPVFQTNPRNERSHVCANECTSTSQIEGCDECETSDDDIEDDEDIVYDWVRNSKLVLNTFIE